MADDFRLGGQDAIVVTLAKQRFICNPSGMILRNTGNLRILILFSAGNDTRQVSPLTWGSAVCQVRRVGTYQLVLNRDRGAT